MKMVAGSPRRQATTRRDAYAVQDEDELKILSRPRSRPRLGVPDDNLDELQKGKAVAIFPRRRALPRDGLGGAGGPGRFLPLGRSS